MMPGKNGKESIQAKCRDERMKKVVEKKSRQFLTNKKGTLVKSMLSPTNKKVCQKLLTIEMEWEWYK